MRIKNFLFFAALSDIISFHFTNAISASDAGNKFEGSCRTKEKLKRERPCRSKNCDAAHKAEKRILSLNPAERKSPTGGKVPGTSRPHSCGPNVAEIILNRYKIAYGRKDIPTLCGTTDEGTSMYGLATTLRKKGLKATGMKISYDDLTDIPYPSIAFIDKTHFVVVGSFEKDGVIKS